MSETSLLTDPQNIARHAVDGLQAGSEITYAITEYDLSQELGHLVFRELVKLLNVSDDEVKHRYTISSMLQKETLIGVGLPSKRELYELKITRHS